MSIRSNSRLRCQLDVMEDDIGEHHLRNILFETSSFKTLVHLSGILQRHACARCMTPPEIKLAIYPPICVIVPNKEFSLFEVGKALEGKVWRPSRISVPGRQWVFRTYRCGRELPRRNYLRCTLRVGVVDDECFPKFERPINWNPLDRNVRFVQDTLV